MGRIAIFATDIFLCLFAVFAALREIVPHYERLPPSYPFVTIRWTESGHDRCLIHAEVDKASSTEVLTETEGPAMADYDGTKSQCILRRPIGADGATNDLTVRLVLPLLQHSNCDDVEVAVLRRTEKLNDCSTPGAHFEAKFRS